MYAKCLIGLLFMMNCYSMYGAEDRYRISIIDSVTLNLFYLEQWDSLLNLGENALKEGVDFPFLRMRLGYAAWNINNHGLCIKHYLASGATGMENQISSLYCFLSSYSLNRLPSARFYLSKCSDQTKKYYKYKTSIQMERIGLEQGIKFPLISDRGTGFYTRIFAHTFLGKRIYWQQSVGFFGQNIRELNLQAVENNQRIAIRQPDLHSRFQFTLANEWSLVGSFHYLHTGFNNYIFKNWLTMGGIRWTRPMQESTVQWHYGQLGDSIFSQVEVQCLWLPYGNTQIALMGKLIRTKEDWIVQGVINKKIKPAVWIEANTTLGRYQQMVDQDNLYVYNDIDTKLFKGGISTYIQIMPKRMIQIHYQGEQKQRIFSTETYSQHSITGGIIWYL